MKGFTDMKVSWNFLKVLKQKLSKCFYYHIYLIIMHYNLLALNLFVARVYKKLGYRY